MRSVLLTVCALVGSAVAGSEMLTLGEYSDRVRERVVEKVREALDTQGHSAEVSGTVTFAGSSSFFIQRDADGIKVLARAPMPKAGDVVTVKGRPSLEGGRVVFVADGWEAKATEAVPDAVEVGMSDLIDADNPQRDVNWLRVVLEGRAIGVTENGFAVKVDEVPVNITVAPVPEFLANCHRTHPLVRVTGVAELMLDQSALTGRDRYVLGVRINVQNADEVELIPDAEYLAALHNRAFTVAAVSVASVLMAGLLVFAIVLIRQRRRLFRTRTIMAERKRMADDLHDTIEQHLVGAGMLLKVNRIKEAQDVLVRAKREIRDIVWGLKNDDMMRLSPAEMLRQLAHAENIKGICRVDVRLGGMPDRMDAAAMRDLSLIVREAIGNAVKHGGARKIAISADRTEDGGWRLRISNDGAVFDPATAPGAAEGHFGIEGMKQRARRIGAELTISRRGTGMLVNIEKGGDK